MSNIRIFISDIDNEGTWEDINESLLDLSDHDAEVRADAIAELKEKYLDADAYNEGLEDGRADAIEEVIKAIDEQNYCMQEECPFNACRFEGCPINRNAEVIFQTWLKKLKEGV